MSEEQANRPWVTALTLLTAAMATLIAIACGVEPDQVLLRAATCAATTCALGVVVKEVCKLVVTESSN